jgi:hypothetical protein
MELRLPESSLVVIVDDTGHERLVEGHNDYEIKTACSPRACLREALGQVPEYVCWPGAQEPARLIICGEGPLDAYGAAYLRCLNERFKLPLAYEQIVLEN